MVRVDRGILVESVRALSLAGHYDLALRLLGGALADAADRPGLALAAAEVAADSTWFVGKPAAEEYLSKAGAAVRAADDQVAAWDLDLLRLRLDYGAALAGGADDSEAAHRLEEQAAALRAAAPDDRRRGWTAFWAGVIADNVSHQPDAAAAQYRVALAMAEANGDDLLASYAQRHLGGQAHEAGELPLARERAWRSAELRERVGFVPGTLAQRLALAEVLLDSGDAAGAAALARDIGRAATARGWTRLADEAAMLLARLGT
jgi:hypothetical protein